MDDPDFRELFDHHYLDDSTVRLFIVATDKHLVRAMRVLDRRKQFELTRFHSLKNAVEKSKFDRHIILLVQYFSEEITELFPVFQTLTSSFFSSRLFVYVPDLPKQNRTVSEAIRFAFLQLGTTAVIASQQELKSLLPAFVEASKKTPSESLTKCDLFRNEDLIRSLHHRLPWSDD